MSHYTCTWFTHTVPQWLSTDLKCLLHTTLAYVYMWPTDKIYSYTSARTNKKSKLNSVKPKCESSFVSISPRLPNQHCLLKVPRLHCLVLVRQWSVWGTGGIIQKVQTEVLGEKYVAVPLCSPPIIWHAVAWYITPSWRGERPATNRQIHGRPKWTNLICIIWKISSFRVENSVLPLAILTSEYCKREIIAVCWEICKKHSNTLCRHSAEFSMFNLMERILTTAL